MKLGSPILGSNVASAWMVAVALGENGVGGGLVPQSVPDRHGSPADEKGAGRISCRENSFNYSKEALHLCMDISMHGFLDRFISFIDM